MQFFRAGDGRLVLWRHLLRRLGRGGRAVLHRFHHVAVRHFRGSLHRRHAPAELLLDSNRSTIDRTLSHRVDLFAVHQHRAAARLEGAERATYSGRQY